MIHEKLDAEELALVEILRHPIFFGEFIKALEQQNEDAEPFEYSEYQKEILCDFNSFVNLTCARSVGKTVSLTHRILWLMINLFYDETILFLVPNRVHLSPVFLTLSKYFRFHPFLSLFADRNSINGSNYTIRLISGAFLDCRIAGQTNSEAPVSGLHVTFILVDESAFIPFGTFQGLQPCLNSFQKGYQMMVAGTPDGRREKSVNFYCDMVDTSYSHHRVTAHQNPRYSEEDEQRNIEKYGGIDSEEYVHSVLGQHGQPVYSMFDRNFMNIQDYEIFIDSKKGKDLDSSGAIFNYAATLPQLPAYYDAIIFGVDLGYTQPSAITVLYRLKDKFWFHSRIQLKQVDYPLQEKLIDLMDSKYKPVIIGIDAGAGGSGKSVIQHLIGDDAYLSKNYKQRIYPVEFGGTTSIGFDDNGDELFIKTKQFGMQKLQATTNKKDLVFSRYDDEMIGELERTRYSKTENGNIKYSVESFTGKEGKGEDHNTASLVCALLGWYSKFEIVAASPEKKILKLFKWWDTYD